MDTPKPFALSAGATVACGIAFVGMAMYWLRAPEPKERVIVPEPEVRYVDKYPSVDRPPRVDYPREAPRPEPPRVEAPPPRAETPAPPAEVLSPRAEARAKLLSPAARLTHGSPWDGIWRIPDRPSPVFELKKDGDSLSGTFTPLDLSGSYPFTDGTANGKEAKFTVEDPKNAYEKLYLRMTLQREGIAVIDGMKKYEDVLKKIQATTRANVYERELLKRELESAGKFYRIGVFQRAPDGN
jgi:hypothetical protein